MPLMKLCSWNGCNKVLGNGVIYCEQHQKKWEAKERERYKEYQNRRRRDKEQKKFQDFYNNEEWKRIREATINGYYGMDILEFYRTGNIIQGEAVHHIIELEDDWNCRVDISNLIYLTEKNHRRVHVEYEKGYKEKKNMQNILFNLIDEFNREYG
jgi:5-methylcytosine-specific restriction endonuclease McrA